MSTSTPIQLPPEDIDRIIHEPARLRIVALLYVLKSADYTFVMQQTGMTWGNLSAHLNKLEKAGYVEIIKEFVNRKPHSMLRLTSAGRAAWQAYRQQMKDLLDELPD
ncbi:MAG TPA: transcriptional regulator [Anaerolineales bacterium]|nr:transcriptional regulator [Anaerolineales bacterium]